MENVLGIVLGILIFGCIIFVHEFGHFIVAKLSKVKVNEFALGMGPQIFKFGKKETVYSLRLFPIGGFCSMEGEDETSEDGGAFCKKPVWKRIAIVVAGAVMNIILGFVLVTIMLLVSGRIITTQVAEFSENAKSHQTGLQAEDQILEVNGMKVFTDMDISYQFQSDSDGVFDMVVKRDGKKVNLNNVTFDKSGDILHIDFKVYAQKITVPKLASSTVKTTASYARLIWISLGDLVTGQYKLNDLSGPVGIFDSIGQVVKSETSDNKIDWSALVDKLLFLAAFMTINVGIFNLLPLPALDGGRLIFLIIEAIRGKPVKPEREGLVHFIGFALLMLLMIVITFSDILRIFKR